MSYLASNRIRVSLFSGGMTESIAEPGSSAAATARCNAGPLPAALDRLGVTLMTSLFPFHGRTWVTASAGG